VDVSVRDDERLTIEAEMPVVVEALRRLPAVRPSPALAWRARAAAEARLAERAERRWTRAALGFLVAFGWTMAVVAWLLVDVATSVLALQFDRPLGSIAAWYAAYLVAGWLSAGAAALLLGRRRQEEGRVA
jgi:hypothetical protein